jgi:hypothetical protein
MTVTLVGYLLFYLNAMGVRVILQTGKGGIGGILGIVFDDDGVRGISVRDITKYARGKPYCLLVSADGPETYPSPELKFCAASIVVTSPNLKSKPHLKSWWKQVEAERFVATPPSCLEVVYLLYVKFFKQLSLVVG